MDFFEHQDQARKHTALMVGLFLASVGCILLAINLVGASIFISFSDVPIFPFGAALAAVPTKAYWITSAVVLAIIGVGTAKRTFELSGGGAAVAELVGARRVKRDSQDPAERRLLNVVEEMAIASGINVPLVFVMDEQNYINAFAAGYSPNEAAITVTRGTLDTLNRDELQGVVAHEFSHILNGDMRLNVRLMGVISGIVMIAALGRFAMEVGGGGRGRSNSISSDRNRGDMRIFILGLVIWIIGSIGEFFGSIIKAAISRQREFLADASAVQFTRNPEGIGGALYKISQRGSHVHEVHAEELSHMFFGAPLANLLFETHPPLEKRIERVMGPGAHHILKDREKRAGAAAQAAAPSPVVEEFQSPLLVAASGLASTAGGPVAASSAPAPGNQAQLTPAQVVASIGTLSEAHVEHARRLIDGLPPTLHQALGTEAGARAAVFALLLGEGEVRKRQLEAISTACGASLAEQAAQLAEQMKPLGVRARLPVFELAAPSLSSLEQSLREATLAVITTLIQADGKVTLGEFVLLTLCRRHLEKPAKGAPPVKHSTLQSAAKETEIVLALLARASPEGEAAFSRVIESLGLNAAASRRLPSFSLAMVEAALYELKLLAPLKKPALIKACLEIVMADGRITLTEGELMRAICAALDSPLPPLLENTAGWKDEPAAR